MAEGIKDSNEVIIQQTFSIPIGKEGKAKFLSDFLGNFDAEFIRDADVILSENLGVAKLVNAITSGIDNSVPKQQVDSLKSGMLFGYKLIRDSATTRDISIPLITDEDVAGFVDDMNGIKGVNSLKLEQMEVQKEDPIFNETMGFLSMQASNRDTFYQGAIMIHYAINRKNQEIGLKTGRYGNIIVK